MELRETEIEMKRDRIEEDKKKEERGKGQEKHEDAVHIGYGSNNETYNES